MPHVSGAVAMPNDPASDRVETLLLAAKVRKTRQEICLQKMERGGELFAQKQYDEARTAYAQAIAFIVGKGNPVPLTVAQNGGIKHPLYIDLTMDERVNFMRCCNRIAECYVKTGNLGEALDWFDEVHVLYKNARFATEPAFDWVDYQPQPLRDDLLAERIAALLGAADVFSSIWNTAAAAHNRVIARATVNSLPEWFQSSRIKKVLPQGVVQLIMNLRHPDPHSHLRLHITNDALQVLGSWKRIKPPEHISPRKAFASFIWQSRLYIAGGMASTRGTRPFRDFQCLDLKRPGKWRRLPPCPGQRSYVYMRFAIHQSKAYIFKGEPILEYFDLVTERWGQMKTSFIDEAGKSIPWPISTQLLWDYAVNMVDGYIYVFGGRTEWYEIGVDFFARLDLGTRKWRLLSGTTGENAVPDHDAPGPRKFAASWIDGKRDRIYIMHGMADLSTRCLPSLEEKGHLKLVEQGQMGMPVDSYPYDDCWSWSIKESRWRRERIMGNVPCPRSEMSYTYNSKLNATIIYGGHSPRMPTFLGDRPFSCAYFADTYILDHKAAQPRWKYVVTRGFPTYRAQGALLTDPDTGRMYLFGGCTNTEMVPSGNEPQARSFKDLWELRIDVPGGHFDEVNVEDETRNARMGPWQKCFTCANVGPHYRQCKGTCGGRAFFCDQQCFEEGWSEHREVHSCRKRK